MPLVSAVGDQPDSGALRDPLIRAHFPDRADLVPELGGSETGAGIQRSAATGAGLCRSRKGAKVTRKRIPGGSIGLAHPSPLRIRFHPPDRKDGFMAEQRTAHPRSASIKVSLSPEIKSQIQECAAEMGVSPAHWCAFRLGEAVNVQRRVSSTMSAMGRDLATMMMETGSEDG